MLEKVTGAEGPAFTTETKGKTCLLDPKMISFHLEVSGLQDTPAADPEVEDADEAEEEEKEEKTGWAVRFEIANE